MGGGKRNYNSMRARSRQWGKGDKVEPEEKKKKLNKEDVKKLLELFPELKGKNDE